MTENKHRLTASQTFIKQEFDSYFSNWDIMLPDATFLDCPQGAIMERGWDIMYRYYASETAGRDHLDFYAAHRMTNDRHLRYYGDGTVEGLPTFSTMIVIKKGDSPEDTQAQQDEQSAYNDRVEKMLQEKGFVMPHEAEPINRINRYLATHRHEAHDADGDT